MKKEITLTVETVSVDELTVADKHIRNAAINAAQKAYAPYSHFQVGAAALLENGAIVTGNNQENIAYPSGLCAERIALVAAGAAYPDIPINTLAIVAVLNEEIRPSIAPCGACRQVMVETERRYGQPLRILMCGRDETIIVSTAHDLLPFVFK